MALTFLTTLFANCYNKSKRKYPLALTAQKQSIHQFTVNDLYGKAFHFSSLKGQKILVVNTASKCGLTPQYEGLQKLYETYKNQNFTIIGFPANNFMSQEPGTDGDIASFCQKNYGVSFPMMSKLSVKGENQAPIYQFLTQKKYNGNVDSSVKWNFQKFLINEKGYVVQSILPTTSPLSSKITNWITH